MPLSFSSFAVPLLFLLLFSGLSPALGATVVSIKAVTTIAKTDDNFVCATMDWWPPDKCNYGMCPWGNASILNLVFVFHSPTLWSASMHVKNPATMFCLTHVLHMLAKIHGNLELRFYPVISWFMSDMKNYPQRNIYIYIFVCTSFHLVDHCFMSNLFFLMCNKGDLHFC